MFPFLTSLFMMFTKVTAKYLHWLMSSQYLADVTNPLGLILGGVMSAIFTLCYFFHTLQ